MFSESNIIRCVCLGAALLGGSHALAADKITLLYYERPPYSSPTDSGDVQGLTATPAAKAFNKAGLSFEWARMAFTRQLELIKENVGPACSVSAFHTAERAQFAKFTKAIYQDKPFIGLTPKQFIVPPGYTVKQVLGMKDIRLLVKEGFSYGAMDEHIRTLKPVIISTPVEVVQMIQMLKANRADLIIVAEEEGDYLIKQAGLNAANFNVVHFSDSPAGTKRYLMCSKKVPDEVIRKLNAVIVFE